jgi:G:T-mismatch repair DNA endonuclease (very short patch repair protein)
MTLARRLAKLEAGITPTEAVLAWLAEAHTYPTLPEHVASIHDAPQEAWPLVRIAAQVKASVRASVRGRPEEVWQAVRAGVGDAFFLVELALQLNLAARQVCDTEGLRWALLVKWRGLLAAEAELAQRTGHGDPERAAREAQDWRDVVALSLTMLYTEDAARASLERRYLEGQPVLFPLLAQECADLVEHLEWLAEHADPMVASTPDSNTDVWMDGLRAAAAEDGQARARELTDLARIEAWELIGEHERALTVLDRRMRPLVPSPRGSTPAEDQGPAA